MNTLDASYDQLKMPVKSLDALSLEQMKSQLLFSQEMRSLKDFVLENIPSDKDYFASGLVFCVFLNNFDKSYNTSKLMKDRTIFRKTIESYVRLKPTEGSWLNEKLSEWGQTQETLEIFFDKLVAYYNAYYAGSREDDVSLKEEHMTFLEQYMKARTLSEFDKQYFIGASDEFLNYYLLKNMSVSKYADVSHPYECQKEDMDMIKRILDCYALQKTDMVTKLEEYLLYRKNSKKFLESVKIWNRKKKEEELKLFGKEDFFSYVKELNKYVQYMEIFSMLDEKASAECVLDRTYLHDLLQRTMVLVEKQGKVEKIEY